jgi:diguanylate cyclase (GGDEF)-like protein
VVPAERLLEVAGALSDGAARLHEQLRHLEPAVRDAVVDLVAEHVTEIVKLWSDMVRGVVVTGDDTPRGTDNFDDSDDVEPERPRYVTSSRPVHADADHPARITAFAAGPASAPTPEVHRQPAEAPRDSDRVTRDQLTGVLNRQAGFVALGREIDRCRRGSERFVLGYLNVDRLKVVNDTQGPRAGDELLRKVTAALRATLRSYDVISRLGGDEFLFSLPGADMATAELRFKEFAVILAEEAPGSSASVGFTELRQHDTLDDLVAGAESAMLKSRRNRRRGRG